MDILSMDMSFIMKNTGMEERHTTAVFILRDRLLVSLKLTTTVLEEVIELQYHSEQNRVFLFKCYWYDTTDRGIRVDPHYGLVEINSKARHRNVNDVFVFAKQCQ
jgi:hypothetical protein